MLSCLLTISLVVLAYSEAIVNDVQEERWDPVEMTSSQALDMNPKTLRHLWCPVGGCCYSRWSSCHHVLGGTCVKDDVLEDAQCDLVAPGNECRWGRDCSCCIKCSDPSRCIDNGGTCQVDRECPVNAYVDIFSPCRACACVCCQKCIQTSECTDGENDDIGLCTGNAEKLLLNDPFYEPSTPLKCDNPECSCVLECGGTKCIDNNGMCIKKGKPCPMGFKADGTSRTCGCNDNDTCKCCLPVNGPPPNC
ncbi:hypothetical protein Pmani_006960 [Petrolisthes manimaculis]|uniref:Uncharacterized protein n=1 Tax=Petrolisthes manimaculis TaxID=1843537 RepID=A0AAE1PDT8_9EUCA|nr:hypothetical protein Pmani_021956 [Petrolisthes manimaculis]KAK4314367.1 hypothetical protein Pmani_014321 [Petrolisthes manimaculis]KAK4322289.1 hypothetical protein Pmani_006960 [Petrolisthes manimaculis]